MSQGRARGSRTRTSPNPARTPGMITSPTRPGKLARAAAERSPPTSLPAAAVKPTGYTTSALSLVRPACTASRSAHQPFALRAGLWLTRRGDGAHTSASPPFRWWAPTHPVRWADQTHAARHAEIAALLARPEVARIERFRFTSPRQAATSLTSLHR